MTIAPLRDGFRTVTPRIVVADVSAQLEFLRVVFGGIGELGADGLSEIRIGDSLILVASAVDRAAFPAFLYVYVVDADATFARAVAAGAVVIEEPLDTPYGDRRAMVRDPFGNVWQIAHLRESSGSRVE
ncbi:VOC family protein [soil metagenome]